MVFNINQFSAKIRSTGLAKNNLFVAQITPPGGMNLPVVRDIPFFCKSSNLPGQEISTSDVRIQGWGKVEKRPTDFVKSDLTLIFMVDSNFAVMQFFHRWMQRVVNYNDINGDLSEDSRGKLPYEFDYKDNYVGSIDVVLFSEHTPAAEKSYAYKFYKAYPTSVSQIQTSWENAAEVLTIVVTFAYDSMYVAGMEQTRNSGRSTSPTIFPSQNFTFGSSFPSTILGGSIQDAVNRVTAPLNSIINSINTVTNAFNSIRKLF
jgi:hypothetical protein